MVRKNLLSQLYYGQRKSRLWSLQSRLNMVSFEVGSFGLFSAILTLGHTCKMRTTTVVQGSVGGGGRGGGKKSNFGHPMATSKVMDT